MVEKELNTIEMKILNCNCYLAIGYSLLTSIVGCICVLCGTG